MDICYRVALQPPSEAGRGTAFIPAGQKRKPSLQRGLEVAQGHIVTGGQLGSYPGLGPPDPLLVLAVEWQASSVSSLHSAPTINRLANVVMHCMTV